MKGPFSKYGVIILAAGSSSRIGKAKQLLTFNNKSLICHIAEESMEAAGNNVIVVLGAYADQIRPELDHLEIITIENKDWEEGMASSIRTGVSAMLALQVSPEGIILAVCDQPFVSGELLKELIILKEQTDRGIVASMYDETLGTPVLFCKKYFPELLALKGTDGAKKLLMKYDDDLTSVPFPAGGTDIDTNEDYIRLNQLS